MKLIKRNLSNIILYPSPHQFLISDLGLSNGWFKRRMDNYTKSRFLTNELCADMNDHAFDNRNSSSNENINRTDKILSCIKLGLLNGENSKPGVTLLYVAAQVN